MFELYYVGGYVRDTLLGYVSHDRDIVAVPHAPPSDDAVYEDVAKQLMEWLVETRGLQVCFFHERTMCIRGKLRGQIVDIVLARADRYADPTTRVPTLRLGTLCDDLRRRDFTVNALAVRVDDPIDRAHVVAADPAHLQDLDDRILRVPSEDPLCTFTEDPLRVLRALRFAVTRNCRCAPDVQDAMRDPRVVDRLFTPSVVSKDRVREELTTMFDHDVPATMRLLCDEDVRQGGRWLERLFADTRFLPSHRQRR